MARTDTVIIGGGQAGLAMSRCLCDYGIDHVVLERGQVAERWRTGHWDSLRLLTPNWMSKLPGFRYGGPDPDGYMRAAEVAAYLERYARSFVAPVQAQTRVLSVGASGNGYRVTTDRGSWDSRSVVIATGHCDRPAVPALAEQLRGELAQYDVASYRNPAQLPSGGVLVVGASASGVQFADEIQRSGRPVTLAVGSHTRLPRRYRGRDIVSWLDRMGVLDQRIEDSAHLQAALKQPSWQLAGTTDARTLDLAALQQRGVQLVGRAAAVSGMRMSFADDLGATTRAADAKLARLLDRIDAFAAVSGSGGVSDRDGEEPVRATSLRLTAVRAPTVINLRRSRINSVVWATGYARSYRWLELPLLDARGELRQRGGITEAHGVYTLGLRLQRRRKSNFLGGVGEDARELAQHLALTLGARTSHAA